LPGAEQAVDRPPGAVPLRHVTPRAAGARPESDAVDRLSSRPSPTPVRLSPTGNESARRPKGHAGSGHGNRYLARILGEVAVSAGRPDTFLGERYRRLARCRGRNRAIVAIGRSILVIIWALLSDDDARFVGLGADYHASRTNPERKVRQHLRELQALGYTVTLNPAG
jgi:transposase